MPKETSSSFARAGRFLASRHDARGGFDARPGLAGAGGSTSAKPGQLSAGEVAPAWTPPRQPAPPVRPAARGRRRTRPRARTSDRGRARASSSSPGREGGGRVSRARGRLGSRSAIAPARRWPAKSKWFVGSSRMRSSAGCERTAARCDALGLTAGQLGDVSAPGRPHPRRSKAASDSQPSPTADDTVPGGSSGSCGRYPMRTPRPRRICPESGASTPAMTRSSVDLPVPLIPTTPRRSPSITVRESSSNRARSLRRTVTCWRSARTGT